MSGGRKPRGVALIQALLITAALAAVASALLLRADRARERLEWRAGADQAMLYISSGIDLVRQNLPEDLVDDAQPWARPVQGVVIDRGFLGWQVSDLQGRFNLNLLLPDAADPEAVAPLRGIFTRLAQSHNLPAPALAQVLASFEAADAPFPLSQLLYLRQSLEPAARPAWDALSQDLAFWPPEEPMNLNTLRPGVVAAALPGIGAMRLGILTRALVSTSFEDPADFMALVEARLGPDAAMALEALPLGITSRLFEIRMEAQLDSLTLRRSVVIDTGGPDGAGAVLMSLPGFE